MTLENKQQEECMHCYIDYYTSLGYKIGCIRYEHITHLKDFNGKRCSHLEVIGHDWKKHLANNPYVTYDNIVNELEQKCQEDIMLEVILKKNPRRIY